MSAAEVRRRAAILANLRRSWAEEFLRLRNLGGASTDNQAKAGADAVYIHDLTLAEAEYQIALAELNRRT